MNLLFFFFTFLVYGRVSSFSKHPIVIVVAFDGFSYKYVNESRTPNILQIRKNGTYADHIRNVFVTKTYTNFFSVSTGLYPETHGVLDNSYYDPITERAVHYSDELFHFRDDIIPIWILNEIEDSTRHSGIMMWPSGEFEYNGINTTFCEVLNMSVPWDKRIETVISWIEHPLTPANLIMLYFDEPDETAHVYGPKHHITLEAITQVDKTVKILYEKIQNLHLVNPVNVLILSDHGMTTVPYENIINHTQYIDPSYFNQSGSTPTLGFFPHKGFEDIVYTALKNASSKENFTLFRKEDIPDAWKFRNNTRCPPLLAVADLGFAFYDVYEPRSLTTLKHNLPYNASFGMHGYSNNESDMWPFFLAWGTNIKKNKQILPFDCVDLYPLIVHLLNMTEYPTQGNILNVKDMLLKSTNVPPAVWKYIAVVLSFAIVILLVGFLCLYIRIRRLKEREQIESVCHYSPLSNTDSNLLYMTQEETGAESETSDIILCATDEEPEKLFCEDQAPAESESLLPPSKACVSL